MCAVLAGRGILIFTYEYCLDFILNELSLILTVLRAVDWRENLFWSKH